MIHELRWNTNLRYLSVMKVVTVLEFLALICGIATAYVLQLNIVSKLAVTVFCILRVVTAHLNHRYVADALGATDQYMFYPFFYFLRFLGCFFFCALARFSSSLCLRVSSCSPTLFIASSKVLTISAISAVTLR